MKFSLAVVLFLGLFTFSLTGCGGGGTEVVLPDEDTELSSEAEMEAYNKEYEAEMQDPNQN